MKLRWSVFVTLFRWLSARWRRETAGPQIVKVETKLWPSSEPALIYPRSGNPRTRQRLSADIKDQMGGAVRGYFEAEFDVDARHWKLGKRVSNQAW
jgi:hypothetical protein